MKKFDLVVLGLSLSSSWGNGHATTYRALLKAYAARRHKILFLERERPWYAEHRDLSDPDFCALALYESIEQLDSYAEQIADAEAVMVGSFVPDGIAVGRYAQTHARGIVAFYDIDTPVTLERLAAGSCEYLSADLIPGYDLYLSFTGGPTLQHLVKRFGAPAAYPLYCSVDETFYRPTEARPLYDLGYLGTYAPDRQEILENLLVEPARRAPHLSFIIAGPLYPDAIDWPPNVTYARHIAPVDHPAFYNSCRFALNITRADMVRAGYSPSVRLFEAAACGTPIISDSWPGLETIFAPSAEIIPAKNPEAVLAILENTPATARKAIAVHARKRILSAHTAAHRAAELETYIRSTISKRIGKDDFEPMKDMRVETTCVS